MSDAKPDTEKPNSPLPAVLLAVAVLAVAAVLIFWPSDESVEGQASGDRVYGAVDGAAGGVGGEGGAIPARDHDPASQDRGLDRAAARDRPRQMLEEPPPPKTRTFKSKDEEIAWYEDQRKKALVIVEMRKRAMDRLSETADANLADAERSRRVVEGNLQEAEARLTEIENRLRELRGT